MCYIVLRLHNRIRPLVFIIRPRPSLVSIQTFLTSWLWDDETFAYCVVTPEQQENDNVTSSEKYLINVL